MSGGFRDSFTKEDTKEDLLGYDDTAFYYFAISVLTVVAVPWTCNIIYNLVFPGKAQVGKDFPAKSSSGRTLLYCKTSVMINKVDVARQEAKRCTRGSAIFWLLKASLLTAIWVGICGTFLQLGQEKEIAKFDPFTILDVTPQATNPQIKRAYRKLSLIFHPDKNRDDPLAASRFIQITKAYQALTDEVGRRNWEKYGNPDGPQTTKVGIGLPRLLLEKDHNLTILCTFFFILLFVVPMTFICYYQQTKNFAANGVMIDTLQFLGFYVTENSRVKACPEMLAACAESRNMRLRPTDNAHLKQMGMQVVEHKKRTLTMPTIMKNQYLIWAHMQRLHHLMSDELKEDCEEILKFSMKITQAMIEIACMREWFATAQAMIEFRHCLVQGLDVKSSQLLQVPHFNEELVEHCSKAKTSITTLEEFLAQEADFRKELPKIEPHQLLDIEAFCRHVGQVELKATVEVEDESEIVVGDVATVTVHLIRKNLQEMEAMGPAHAPLFPEPKFEEWWFFLVEAPPSTRIIHFERIRDVEHFVEEKLRFQITRPGKQTLVLHALCDSYAGLDQKAELTFNAHAEEEFKRPFPIHQEDEDLDLQPTLYETLKGGFNNEEESEEEEDDRHEKRVRSKPAPPAPQDEKIRRGEGRAE